MGLDLVNFKLDKIVIHQIFDRQLDGSSVPPIYTDSMTVLDQNAVNTFKDRVVKALGDDSHCIEMYVANGTSGSVFDYVCQLLVANDHDFVSVTKNVALKLANSQTSRNIPGGIVLVFSGTVGFNNRRYVGIIKAELHEGFNLETIDRKLSIRYFSELFLTPQMKLYKIAFFKENDDNVSKSQNDFTVLVFDHVMTRTESRSAAKYFYETFLGCEFSPSDKKLTSDFYYYTKDFINNLEMTDEDKLDLQSSLYSYLKVNQSSQVQVSTFAQDFLPLNLRDTYRTFMEDKNFPSHAINKDITNLKNKLRLRDIRFTSHVRITAPPEQFDELVKIKEYEYDHTIVSIKGKMEREA